MIVKKFLRRIGATLVAEAKLLIAKDLVARGRDCRSAFRVRDITMIAKRTSRWLLS
jgi:hypothetical protein